MNGAPWWVTLVVAVITAAAALGGSALVTWRQNARALREEWFRRVQWAHQLTESGRDRTQAAGYRLLELLGDSPLAQDEDRELLLQLVQDEGLTALTQADTAFLDDIEYVVDTDDTDTREMHTREMHTREMDSAAESTEEGR